MIVTILKASAPFRSASSSPKAAADPTSESSAVKLFGDDNDGSWNRHDDHCLHHAFSPVTYVIGTRHGAWLATLPAELCWSLSQCVSMDGLNQPHPWRLSLIVLKMPQARCQNRTAAAATAHSAS